MNNNICQLSGGDYFSLSGNVCLYAWFVTQLWPGNFAGRWISGAGSLWKAVKRTKVGNSCLDLLESRGVESWQKVLPLAAPQKLVTGIPALTVGVQTLLPLTDAFIYLLYGRDCELRSAGQRWTPLAQTISQTFVSLEFFH